MKVPEAGLVRYETLLIVQVNDAPKKAPRQIGMLFNAIRGSELDRQAGPWARKVLPLRLAFHQAFTEVGDSLAGGVTMALHDRPVDNLGTPLNGLQPPVLFRAIHLEASHPQWIVLNVPLLLKERCDVLPRHLEVIGKHGAVCLTDRA